MATNIKGLFQNNRRREASALTATFPAVIESADLRAGTAEVVVASGDYTAATIPAGVVITNVFTVVDDVFDSVTSATLTGKVGATAVTAAVDVKAAGLTKSSTNLPMLVTADADFTGTFAIVGATTTGTAKLVIEYITYDGATMSYLGES